MSSTDPFLDPLIHLAYVAAVTDRMELGTGVIVLPQRNPLVLAKQAVCRCPSGAAAPTSTWTRWRPCGPTRHR
ncbi:MAG TPA: LLM class flavin-dependent oxidoreductase [Actinophytocola sp.]|uniref:LLM class flavin-dependent oxidoreductase n=1 Tax=Actinophytocola sp. TaxID=1872138 RepID=UPI002DFA1462|nr:LLM class flavin-dependent oxidoreductase [Actinophytocola sp.]